MVQSKWESLLEQKQELRILAYPRGFFMTDDAEVNAKGHPFYGLWNRSEYFGYTFYVHPKQKICMFSGKEVGLVLIGHAFDPVSVPGEYREEQLLAQAAEQYTRNEIAFTEYFNRWTGLFALFVFTKAGFGFTVMRQVCIRCFMGHAMVIFIVHHIPACWEIFAGYRLIRILID